MIIGYTTGVFDMFHIGHLNILKRAKEQCDYLIVGVSTDELVKHDKNKTPIIQFDDRCRIVEAIKYVDKVVSQPNKDKLAAWEKFHFDKMFVGSDWQGTPQWEKFEEQFAPLGVEIVYIPHTDGISSSILRGKLTTVKKGGGKIIGYTQGTFDMFHIGHLNLIMSAKSHCDKLLVGVNSDELVQQYKNKTPVVNQNDRLAIVKALKCVDDAFLVDTLDKVAVHQTIPFDSIFIGDDWKGNQRWADTEKALSPVGAKVEYLHHTEGISSSLLRTKIEN